MAATLSLPGQNDLSDRWEQDGFLVLKRHFSEAQCDQLNEFASDLWRNRQHSKTAATVDIYLDRLENKRILLREAPDAAYEYSFKINDLYLDEPLLRDYALEPKLCQTLDCLLGGKPLVFNSLLFRWGSQQREHTDTLYMPPLSENKLVVSWIALDEATLANGPLTLYPGSHHIPAYRFSSGRMNAAADEMDNYYRYMEQELDKRGIEPIPFLAQPGDVLIWHAQLLHGGSSIQDWRQTRRSLVTHYYRKQDFRHQFWRLRKHGGGFYLKRPHPRPQ